VYGHTKHQQGEAQSMIAAIISKDASLRARLESALEATRDVESVLIIPDYPGDADIRSLEDTNEKYVAFIDFRDASERAMAVASVINRACPSVGAVALNVSSSQADLIGIVRAGICEVLPQPFSNRDVATAVLNVTRKLAGATGASFADGVVYAFLPAKPGSGASSLAAYSALACARLSDGHPLLLDFDIRLGITSFILKLDSANSIMDALENAGRMDQTLWDQLVTERSNLHVLRSAPAEFGARVPPDSFQSILKWARSQYAVVAVDLPGTMEDFEILTMQQAGTIFLVCGPDLVSLHMARQTIQRIHSVNLLDRVSVVLNRVDKRTGLSIRDIEGILGLPVRVAVPSDERGIREAVEEGTGVSPKSALGVQIEAIARTMVGNLSKGSNPPRPKKRFVEFFSVPQAKGLDPWRL
jgi:pilus assembly protein CpaE